MNGLYHAPLGEMEGGERYREILAPLGMGDELRAALLCDGTCWGMLCLHRQRGDPAFTEEDIAFLRHLTPHIAEGLRAALLLDDVAAVSAAKGPGLILIPDDGAVVAMTPAAEGWLAEMADWPQRNEVPQAVRAVAARLWELECTGAPGPGLMPRVRVRTRAGRWLVLHAARLSGTGGVTAVILEQALPLEIAPLVLQAYALTEREARVAQLVLRGLATREISERLCISALTVQDHLKAILEKMGVNSRRALVAQIFAQHYLPRMTGGAAHGDSV